MARNITENPEARHVPVPTEDEVEALVQIYGEPARDPERAKWLAAHERVIQRFRGAFERLAK